MFQDASEFSENFEVGFVFNVENILAIFGGENV